MSESYQISRLASQVSDQAVIAAHGVNQLRDEIEECLFAWRDKQATQFVLAIEEPQQEVFTPLASALRQAETCLRDLSGMADQTEFTLNQVLLQCEPCKNAATDAARKAETADIHANGAMNAASRASTAALNLQNRISTLGFPPV